jgi:hypothetical protein
MRNAVGHISTLRGDEVIEPETYSQVPHYSTDHNACAQMRARIAEMGLIPTFIMLLARKQEMPRSSEWTTKDLWWLINATPEQQCRAALQAVGVDVE